MKLVDVYTVLPDAIDVLWQLLHERTPEVNISHRGMPTLAEHQAHVSSHPHLHWYLLDVGEDQFVGAVYLSKQREIGIGILRRFQHMGYGKLAVTMLMEKHPGRFLANVNPLNMRSVELFLDLKFRQLQVTYAKEPT